MSKKMWLLSAVMTIAIGCTFAFAACTTSENENEGEGGEKTTVVSLNTASMTLDRYEYGSLQATVTVDDAIDPAAEIVWSTSNEGVVTVNDGQLVPKAEGSATITAASGEASATCTVTVDYSDAVPLLTHTDSIGMTLDGTYTLTPSVTYLDEDTSDAQFSYSVGTGADVVSVEDGVLTATKLGDATVTISASWRGYTAMTKNVAVKVTRDVMLGLTVDNASLAPSTITLDGTPYSNTTAATASVRLSGELQDSPQITWKTSDGTVLSVADGTITAKKAGSAYVWFTYSPVAGEEYSSNKVLIDVAIPVLDRTATISKDFDQSAPAELLSSDIFKEDVDVSKDITAVYDSEDLTTNLLQEGKVSTAALAAGEREFIVYNASYACRISAVVATMIIDDFADLKAFKDSVNANASQGGTDGYFILTADIDATDGEGLVFEGGNYSVNNDYPGNGVLVENAGFRGTFDGRGHSIGGFRFGKGGLFGDLNGATVKDLDILQARIEFETGKHHANTVLAHIAQYSTIENCKIEVSFENLDLTCASAVAQTTYMMTYDHVTLLVENNDTNSNSFVNYWYGGDTFNDFVILQIGEDGRLCDPNYSPNVDRRILSYEASAEKDTIYNNTSDGTQLVELKSSVLINGTDGTAAVQDMTWQIASGDDYAELNESVLTAKSNVYGVVQVYFTFEYEGFTFTSNTLTVTITDLLEDKTADVTLIFDLSETTTAINAQEVFGSEYKGTVTSVMLDTDRDTELLKSDAQTVDSTSFGSTFGEQVLVVRGSDGKAYKVSAIIATMVINNLDDLKTFKQMQGTAAQAKTPLNGYFLLGDDIDGMEDGTAYLLVGGSIANPKIEDSIQNVSWTTYVGYYDTYTGGFRGIFNGNGHKLSNFRFGQGGLLGDLIDGTLKNLTITDAVIGAPGQPRTNALVGQGVINATIENCNFTVKMINAEKAESNTNQPGAITYTLHNSTIKDVTVNVTNESAAGTINILACSKSGTNTFTNVNVTYSGKFDDVSSYDTYLGEGKLTLTEATASTDDPTEDAQDATNA